MPESKISPCITGWPGSHLCRGFGQRELQDFGGGKLLGARAAGIGGPAWNQMLDQSFERLPFFDRISQRRVLFPALRPIDSSSSGETVTAPAPTRR